MMKARIVIGLDGKVQMVTDEGTFEEGSEKLERVLKALNLEGIDIAMTQPPEQHRHGPDGEHLTTGGKSVHLHAA